MRCTKWIAVLLVGVMSASFAAYGDDFSLIKKRVASGILKHYVDDEILTIALDRYCDDGTFAELNYDDCSRESGFPQKVHIYYLIYMATAFHNPSSPYYHSEVLKDKITKGLQFWVDHDFIADNWHSNEVTVPAGMTKLLFIFGNQLPPKLVEQARPIAGRANINSWGARPSGDRVVIYGIYAKSLLYLNNRAEFEKVIELIKAEMKFSTGSRGLQHDFCFHHRHDRVNNTVSYGYGKFANTYGEWAYYTAGTKHQFPQEKINLLVDYYLNGIYKQLVYGVYPDVSVLNRSISREDEALFEPKETLEIERILPLTNYRKAEMEEILKLRSGAGGTASSFATFFWQTEHFVFQRPNFYTSVRMHSTRNKNMEVGYNGEGVTTHHRGDGANYVQQRGNEYLGIRPMYDWQKIPGATILQKPALHPHKQVQKSGLTDFVGGISDGLYGAAVFDFISPHDRIHAKKSWFFFDEEYVCLGAGINAEQNLPVVTTVNQCQLTNNVTVCTGGKTSELLEGDHAFEQVDWVLHDHIGYLFPAPASIRLSNQEKEGRWVDLTYHKGASKEPIQKKVFSLWIDHGKQPVDQTYHYMVVPGVSAQELAETSLDQRSIELLSNTVHLQGVLNKKQGICQLAFYRAGKVDVSDNLNLQLDSQGMVMLKLNQNRIQQLTVSDPSRKLNRMLVAVSGIYSVNEPGCTATPDHSIQQTTFMIDLPQDVYAGKSRTFSLE